MPVSSAKSTEQPVGQTTQRAIKSPPRADRPFIRFYHSESLRAKTLAVLVALEEADDSTRHRNALSDIALELVDSGMDYFLMRPLRLAKVGFVVEQTASMGIGGVKRVLTPVIRNIIGRMDEQQLLTVSNHIRDLME